MPESNQNPANSPKLPPRGRRILSKAERIANRNARAKLPLTGHYDKRKVNTNLVAYNKALAKEGRKPLGRHKVSGRRCVTLLRKMDAHKDPVQMFIDAIEAKSYALAWQIRSDVETRALGRPYTAVNPEENERHSGEDVTRIAVAIRNLQIVSGSEDKAKRLGQIQGSKSLVSGQIKGKKKAARALLEANSEALMAKGVTLAAQGGSDVVEDVGLRILESPVLTGHPSSREGP
jgi:hypothetical protein